MSNEQKWTPEPWAPEWPLGCIRAATRRDGIDRHLFLPTEAESADTNRANASRVAACVNACAGMHDPELSISALRARSENIPALCAELEAIRARRDELAAALRLFLRAGVGNSTDFHVQAEAINAARATLAKVQP